MLFFISLGNTFVYIPHMKIPEKSLWPTEKYKILKW